jgi:ribosomal protein L37AE/L43A
MDIILNCPQCSAEVSLEEDASVFRCRYCDSVLMPTGRNEVQSFFFPPKGTKTQVGKALLKALAKKQMGRLQIGGAELVYAPYWRVAGLLFQHAFGKIYENTLYGGTSYDYFKRLRAVAYDRTFPAFTSDHWEVFSLGLRAEVMKMWPYNKEKMGKEALVIGEDIPLEKAAEMALQVPYPGGGTDREKIELLKTELIGERYSLVYFPFYCFSMTQEGEEIPLLVDALSHKVVKGRLSISELKKQSGREEVPYRPLHFIPFKCPNCGWDLPYRPKARIHLCRTCGRAWQETAEAFEEVSYGVVLPGEGEGAGSDAFTYLPFWRLTVAIAGSEREYKNLWDFYQLFPLPRVLDREMMEKRPIHFFIPAFRVRNAAAVDRFAVQMARNQPEFNVLETEEFKDIRAADVWLPTAEAVEMAHILIYSMIPKRAKRTRKEVHDARLRLEEGHLIWLPFAEKGIFLREVHHDFAIQKNCLELD